MAVLLSLLGDVRERLWRVGPSFLKKIARRDFLLFPWVLLYIVVDHSSSQGERGTLGTVLMS